MSEQNSAPSPEQRIAALLTPQDEAPVREAPVREAREVPAEAPPEVAQEAPEPVTDDDDGDAIETLNDLAEALGVDVADLYGVRLPVDIDGQGKEELTIGEWKDRYRDSKVLEAQRVELDQRRSQVEEMYKQRVAAVEAKEQEQAEMLGYMEQQVFSQYAGVDWNQLRQQDPGQWAALSMQFEQEKARLAQLRSAAAVKWDNTRRELGQAEEARNREIAAQEWRQMMEAVPEWKDPTKYEADAAKLSHFLLSSGYTQEELKSIRLKHVLLARDAMRYREMMKSSDANKKRVFKLGKKVLTPGARTSTAEQTGQKTAALSNRLRKSGNIQDAAALISERMKG